MTDDIELWTIDQVVAYLKASSPGSARRTLSRWGVKAVAYRPGPSGRPMAHWSASTVRAAVQTRKTRRARRR